MDWRPSKAQTVPLLLPRNIFMQQRLYALWETFMINRGTQSVFLIIEPANTTAK